MRKLPDREVQHAWGAIVAVELAAVLLLQGKSALDSPLYYVSQADPQATLKVTQLSFFALGSDE